MSSQLDMFEHPKTARLLEIKRKIAGYQEAITELSVEARALTEEATRYPLNEDRTVQVVVGPGGRPFILVRHPRIGSSAGGRGLSGEFFPISLDLLRKCVGELTPKENHLDGFEEFIGDDRSVSAY